MTDLEQEKDRPEALFSELESAWQQYANDAVNDGFGLLTPGLS